MITPKEWLQNFKESLQDLIEEAKREQRRVKGVIISSDLFDKIKNATQSEPDNILGYKLTVINSTEIKVLQDLVNDPDIENEFEVEGYIELIDDPLH